MSSIFFCFRSSDQNICPIATNKQALLHKTQKGPTPHQSNGVRPFILSIYWFYLILHCERRENTQPVEVFSSIGKTKLCVSIYRSAERAAVIALLFRIITHHVILYLSIPLTKIIRSVDALSPFWHTDLILHCIHINISHQCQIDTAVHCAFLPHIARYPPERSRFRWSVHLLFHRSVRMQSYPGRK